MKYFNEADIVMFHTRNTVIHGDKGYFGNSFDELKYAVDNDIVGMVDEVKNDSALCFTTYDEGAPGYAMFIKQEYVHSAVVTEPFTSLKHLYELVVPTHDKCLDRPECDSGSVHIGIGSSVYSLQELHDNFEIRLMGHAAYRPIGFYKYNGSLYLNDPSEYTDEELERLAYKD